MRHWSGGEASDTVSKIGRMEEMGGVVCIPGSGILEGFFK